MDDLRPYMHKGYVQTIQTGGFFGVCPSCGHDLFPNRATREEAQRDVDEHLTAVTNSFRRLVQSKP